MSMLTPTFFVDQKTALFTILLTMLWVCTDLNERFFIKSDITEKSINSSANNSFNTPLLAVGTANEILSVYENYKPSKTSIKNVSKPEHIALSAEQLANQQGEMTSLYLKDKKIALKAVIQKGDELFTLLLITNLTTNIETIENFLNHKVVYGYQLDILNNVQVKLTKESAETQQEIILTMYKKHRDTRTPLQQLVSQ